MPAWGGQKGHTIAWRWVLRVRGQSGLRVLAPLRTCGVPERVLKKNNGRNWRALPAVTLDSGAERAGGAHRRYLPQRSSPKAVHACCCLQDLGCPGHIWVLVSAATATPSPVPGAWPNSGAGISLLRCLAALTGLQIPFSLLVLPRTSESQGGAPSYPRSGGASSTARRPGASLLAQT
jgi:hypothetical protein